MAARRVLGNIGNIAVEANGEVIFTHHPLGLVASDFTQFCSPGDSRSKSVLANTCSAAGKHAYDIDGFERLTIDEVTTSYIPRQRLEELIELLEAKQKSRYKESGLERIKLLRYVLAHTCPAEEPLT